MSVPMVENAKVMAKGQITFKRYPHQNSPFTLRPSHTYL